MLFILILYSCLINLISAQNETSSRATLKINNADGYYQSTSETFTIQPNQCKLVAYDMDRSQYRYQIAVNYDNEGCSADVDFFGSELLIPDVFMKTAVKEASLPFELCMLLVDQIELPSKFKQNSILMGWENVSFVPLEVQGELQADLFTCYKGWQYQIFANNCSDQAVEIQVRVDSGGNEDKLVEEGCVEYEYATLFLTVVLLVFISMLFSCICCCCLFCDCCLPCAKFCAGVKKVQHPKADATTVTVELSQQKLKVENSSSNQGVQQNKDKGVEEIVNRASIHSTEGQTRWLTYSMCVASVLSLWLQLYPPQFDTDPYRVDYSAGSICGEYLANNAEGYIKKVCSFVNVFFTSYFVGVSTFIFVLSNYTTRADPWFRFRIIVSGFILLVTNVLIFLDIVVFFYRHEYVQMVGRYYYAYIVIFIHLIITDFLFVYVLVLGYGQNNNQRMLDRSALVKKTVETEQSETIVQNQNSQSRFKKFFVGIWDALKEEEGFRYSVFFLISVASASYLIIYIFITLMYKRDEYLDCLKDFNDCIQREMETYVVFVRRRVGADQVLSLMQDIGVTQISVQDVNETVSELDSVLADGQLFNASVVIKEFASLCESQIIVNLIAASAPQIGQICQQLNSSQLQPVLQALEGDFLGKLQQQTDLIQQLLGQTEDLLQSTSTIIADTQQSSTEWSESIDTPFYIASVIGLVIGLLMGMSVLYITLVSYKKITIHLTLEKCILALSKDELEQSETLKHTLENFSIISSIYFFGIVLSTSVIQMYIFSFLLTFAFTVLFSPWFWTVFLKKYYPYIVVYAGILLINAVLVTRLGNRLISQKLQSIKYPALWLAYYIICSFAYLLLGIFLAVIRLVYLLLTSLIAINRLDISLFTILPMLDNGHKAFMGMVLMAQGLADIGRGRDKKKKKAEARWKKLKMAVKDEEGELIRKIRESPLIQSSLFQAVDEKEYSDDPSQDDHPGNGDQEVAAIKKFLIRSKTAIDSMDANTAPEALVRSLTFSGPSSNSTTSNSPNN